MSQLLQKSKILGSRTCSPGESNGRITIFGQPSFSDGDVTCHQSDFDLPSLDFVSWPLQYGIFGAWLWNALSA